MAEALELKAPDGPWHSARDGIAELAGWLSLVSGALGKMGLDLVQLGQSEVGEVEYRTWLRQMTLAGVDGDEVTVQAGDLLFTIDKRPFENTLAQARANLAQARANLAFAESDLERGKPQKSAARKLHGVSSQ